MPKKTAPSAKKATRRVSRSAGPAPLDALIAPAVLGGADHARVRAAVEALPVEQKQIVELAYFEGLSCSEIASRIATPIGTVKSRAAAALGKLRVRLGASAGEV